MIKKLEGILRLAILCLGVYLVYTLYQPQADRLIREVKEQVFTTTENPAALLTEERQEETEAQKHSPFRRATIPEITAGRLTYGTRKPWYLLGGGGCLLIGGVAAS